MKVYIAGKITGLKGYKKLFANAEKQLKRNGHKIMNPSILPKGFEHEEYMKICYSMIDVCDAVYFLKNWTDSKGAIMEMQYAQVKNKTTLFEVYDENQNSQCIG